MKSATEWTHRMLGDWHFRAFTAWRLLFCTIWFACVDSSGSQRGPGLEFLVVHREIHNSSMKRSLTCVQYSFD